MFGCRWPSLAAGLFLVPSFTPPAQVILHVVGSSFFPAGLAPRSWIRSFFALEFSLASASSHSHAGSISLVSCLEARYLFSFCADPVPPHEHGIGQDLAAVGNFTPFSCRFLFLTRGFQFTASVSLGGFSVLVAT
jgi:hypothetical protein